MTNILYLLSTIFTYVGFLYFTTRVSTNISPLVYSFFSSFFGAVVALAILGVTSLRSGENPFGNIPLSVIGIMLCVGTFVTIFDALLVKSIASYDGAGFVTPLIYGSALLVTYILVMFNQKINFVEISGVALIVFGILTISYSRYLVQQ